jgi:hypothetical protein
MSHDTEATSSKRKLRKYDSAIDTNSAFETNDLNLTHIFSFTVYARAWWSAFMHPLGLSKFFKCTSTSLYSYKHNEQIKSQNIDNSECFSVKVVEIYPEMTSQ